ncbi:MAG: ABC transporter permease [Ferruginibacter sp.]
MQTSIPSTSSVLKTLLRSDFTTQWRNRRSVIMVVLIPVVILITWKPLIKNFGGPFVIANCITLGLNAIGLMGYSTSIARDREKGVFQRIRVAPLPGWTIMVSRLLVQLAMILIVTAACFVVGYSYDHIVIAPIGYIMGFLSALIGGALYLGLGQAIVGLIKSAETVNATVRFIYFIFIMVGMFGELGALGKEIGNIVQWSPYGTVKRIVADSLVPSSWSNHTTYSLLATIGYAIVFAILGIKKFKWDVK